MGDDHRERALRAIRGSDYDTPLRIQARHERHAGNCGIELRAQRGVGSLAKRVRERELAQGGSESSGSNEDVGSDDVIPTEDAAHEEPPTELVWCCNVVPRPLCDLRVDEVLDEIERRRGGGATRRLESFRRRHPRKCTAGGYDTLNG